MGARQIASPLRGDHQRTPHLLRDGSGILIVYCIEILQELGMAECIGYTTGTHLHYSVAFDRNTDTDDGNIFDKPLSNTGSGERIDPRLSNDMHMEPGIGGFD